MSSLFKHGIVERVGGVYMFAKGPHVDLGPDGYKIAITALLGFTPTDWETDEVFRQRNAGLSLAELHDIVSYKLRFHSVEQYMANVCATFDSNRRYFYSLYDHSNQGNFNLKSVQVKGYITLKDIRTVWTEVSSAALPWSKIHECFRELSKGDVMDYGRFFEILSSDEGNLDVKLSNMCLFNHLAL